MKPIQIGDIVGDYRVIEIAGAGGMGAVYKIEHIITRRIEAMKILPPSSSSDPEQIQRFEREIQVQARLHHPNIVALYNAVRDGASIALVMEFVEGESLQRKLEAGPLPVATAVDYAIQVLRALAYAHDNGVIHRDVAPANIIITPERVAKLTDFGLARGAADLRLSASGVPIGSPWYMSPEQVKATGPMDARTDIYATGRGAARDAHGREDVRCRRSLCGDARPRGSHARAAQFAQPRDSHGARWNCGEGRGKRSRVALPVGRRIPAGAPADRHGEPADARAVRAPARNDPLMVLAPAALVASVIIVRELPGSPHAQARQPTAAHADREAGTRARARAATNAGGWWFPQSRCRCQRSKSPWRLRVDAVRRRRGWRASLSATSPSASPAETRFLPIRRRSYPPPAPRMEEAAAPPVAESVDRQAQHPPLRRARTSGGRAGESTERRKPAGESARQSEPLPQGSEARPADPAKTPSKQ